MPLTDSANANFFGIWVLSSDRSRTDPGLPGYDWCVERLTDLGDGRFRLRDRRARRNGEMVRIDSDLAFDGVARAGLNPDETVSYRIVSSRSYTITVKTRGVESVVVTREVSIDGMTMTHVGEGTIRGRPFRNDFVYERAGGKSEADERLLV